MPPYLPPPDDGERLFDEVIDQCRGIQEMQPFFNGMSDGSSVPVLGIGDGIAHVLRDYLEYRGPGKHVEAGKAMAMA